MSRSPRSTALRGKGAKTGLQWKSQHGTQTTLVGRGHPPWARFPQASVLGYGDQGSVLHTVPRGQEGHYMIKQFEVVGRGTGGLTL